MAKIIKYQLMTEVKNTYQIPMEEVEKGYEEKEEITQIFSDVEIKCNASNFDSNYAIAEKEAYNGEITVEDDGEPDPSIEPTTDEILNALLGVE